MSRIKKRLQLATTVMLGSVLCAIMSFAPAVHAANTALTPQAKVSFTFDDGFTSALTKAAPTLAAQGFTATDYVITDCVGTVGTCPANEDANYMTWNELTQLQNTYGWEIGAHSRSHPLMTQLSAAPLENEVHGSKHALTSHGFNPTAFATPYGDYDNKVKASIAKYFTSHRPFADQQWGNDWPYNNYLLYVKQVQMGISVDQVKAYIDEAKQNNQWLVLVFHDIKDVPSTSAEDYEYGISDLAQIAAYVKAQNLPVVNVSNGLVSGDTNLVANSSFNNGVASGWTTDSAANVKKDTAMNGSAPSPQNSIIMNANATKNVHLFSPKVVVNSTKQYVLKSYLNLKSITSGEVTYYIDEYDANDNWISGQYKLGEPNANAGSVNLRYQPTSANVKKASLQIGVSANSGIKAYVDNVEWYVSQ